MCFEVQCPDCKKRTWAGCGKHKDSVLAKIPAEEQCKCKEEAAMAANDKKQNNNNDKAGQDSNNNNQQNQKVGAK